ncbi:unnamed protein product [Notodromas monacha]|uniref:Interference hedgehog n=1 Tax=Notodromas monacha TaxID=399045 RepID=A0A7R9BIA3_9CRUS|nr:unnamed protein product [Notodromas monacha]CAG0915227.1 unnamed protein product [Notodromas monacha]
MGLIEITVIYRNLYVQEDGRCSVLPPEVPSGVLITSVNFTADHRSFIKSPQSIVTPPGDSVNFECQTDPPADKYTWLRNGILLENSTSTKIIDGSLNIKLGIHFEEYDKQLGDYQCVAWFGSSGLASVAGTLDLAQLLPFPSPNGQEKKLAVIEGNAAVIKCQAPFSRPQATITFYKEGAVVFPDGDNGNLIIYDLRMNDTGSYTCSAHNHITNQVQMANVNSSLKVVNTPYTVQPAFKVKPLALNHVVRGSNLTLECVAVGNPPPKVKWTKYGETLNMNRHMLLRSNLKLVNIQKSDEGSYICEAENVKETPVISVPPLDTSVIEDQEVTMTCLAKGRPSPIIDWVFNGRDVRTLSGVRVFENKLVIYRAKKEHAGIFQCFAKNAYGVDTSPAFLFVQPRGVTSSDDLGSKVEKGSDRGNRRGNGKGKRPGRRPSGPNVSSDAMEPPSRPNVTRLTDESVMLTWEMPVTVGALPIQFFKIQYKAMRRRTAWRTLDEEIPPHIRSYAVPGLENGQRYKFRILAAYANNDHSVGPTSKRFLLEADSSDDRPTHPPRIVDSTALGNDSLEIQWEYNQAEKSIEGFFIYYRSTTSAGDYQKVTVMGSAWRSHILRHLEPGTTYDIKIQAFNVGGPSSFSGLITAKTRDYNHGNDSSASNDRRGDAVFGSAFDDEKRNFGLPTEFPLTAMVGAVIGAILFLIAVPCAIAYCRRRINSPGANEETESKFREFPAVGPPEGEPMRIHESRRNGHNGLMANGLRPVSAVVGFSPISLSPSNPVSASCDHLDSPRRPLETLERVNGIQETSFMLIPPSAHPSHASMYQSYPDRQESCSTFLPAAAEQSVSTPPRRRDWRVIDSSPSEIEASWASQQLLSLPDDPSSTTTVEGDDSSIVWRRDERRSSQQNIRPMSWRNDRRRSRDSVRLKREEVS